MNLRPFAAILLTVVLALAPLLLAGCQAAAIVGVMADTFERTGTKDVPADYEGLRGKTYAVVIDADRVIQGNDARAVSRLTNAITRKLAQAADVHGATGFVPGPRVLELQYNQPRWSAWSLGRLADEFGVDVLIFIDLQEYRLGEPGNAYLWEGSVAGKVGVIEADGDSPDDFVYTKDIRVAYPDQSGVTTNQMPRAQVVANLEERFSDRVAWLFFEHEEANMIKY
ncbi:MAG: hypothetical protein ACKVZJ_02425 [Phycisphaerales bacterium]